MFCLMHVMDIKLLFIYIECRVLLMQYSFNFSVMFH